MLSIVARWWIAPGREKKAERALKRLARAVEEQEPLTTMYMIHTSIAEGSGLTPSCKEVVFVGGWPDRAAYEQHLAGPVFKGWIAAYADLFLAEDGGEELVNGEFMATRAGFIRPTAAQEPLDPERALEPDFEYSHA